MAGRPGPGEPTHLTFRRTRPAPGVTLAAVALAAVALTAAGPTGGRTPIRPNPITQPGDSAVYRVLPTSRFTVTTGTAGLLSFAGHRHLIAAREFDGTIVHRLDVPTASTVTIRILTRSLEVLTPPDTAEIRKVSATMRDEVLHTEQHPEITLTTRAATPTAGGFHLVALLTIAGRTREVPIDVSAVVGADTLRGTASFSVKQTDFGLTPYRGGPGGTVRVADVITFHIDLVGARVP